MKYKLKLVLFFIIGIVNFVALGVLWTTPNNVLYEMGVNLVKVQTVIFLIGMIVLSFALYFFNNDIKFRNYSFKKKFFVFSLINIGSILVVLLPITSGILLFVGVMFLGLTV